MMEHSEDNHVDQPALTDDALDTTPESAAVARAEELAEEEAETAAEAAEEELEEERTLAESVEREVEDEPTSSADDLSGRAGGPELAEEVEAVVDEEVVAGEE